MGETTFGQERPVGRITVSVVIPTRDRPGSLARTLDALASQTRSPEEVIVVDASDPPVEDDVVRSRFPRCVVIRTEPSLCAQRNEGIRRAVGTHVLLLDDDIEVPPDYLEKLTAHMAAHPSTGATSGIVRERNGEKGFSGGLERPRTGRLLFAFVFQLSVWGDVGGTVEAPLSGWLLSPVRWWYRRRGNTWSAAGWPLVTQVGGEAFETATYGLGAALVRRAWLLESPYDERLGRHGIGDNYGVALGFPGRITVLTNVSVTHHRASEGRLEPSEAYFQRILALDYFIRTTGRFSRRTPLVLAWSLVGNALAFALGGRPRFLRRTVSALLRVVSGRNPLVLAAYGTTERGS